MIIGWLAAQAVAMGSLAGSGWEVTFTNQATPEVRLDGSAIVAAEAVFWGPEWKWAQAEFGVEPGGAGASNGGAPFRGRVVDLGLLYRGKAKATAPNRLRVEYEQEATRKLDGVIGGGLEFRLHPPAGARAPKLLPGNRGWSWEPEAGKVIAVEFDPPAASVYFEQGDAKRIRAFLLAEGVEAGRKSVAMTVALPEGGKVGKSLDERYGPVDRSKWFKNVLVDKSGKVEGSPVDLRFLNAGAVPAGVRGPVRAEGDALVFADGTPARFWGANLQAYALFRTPREEVPAQARRLAMLGFNLARIHHHDSARWVQPSAIAPGADSRRLDEAALDALDWWIANLEREGIHIWLDLHVGRPFRQGDGIPGFAELLKEGGEAKGFGLINPRVGELMREFNEKYLGHVNPYTRRAYKDDPAVVGLLITNENDLTHHFGNLFLPDKGNPHHQSLFQELAGAFCADAGLPVDRALRTWEPGPAKAVLNELEHRFHRGMIRHLREQVGTKAPIATTNTWGNMPLYGLPALTAGDVIDAHSYGKAEFLSADPGREANFAHWLAAAQVEGKPLTITEWNAEYPAADRFISAIYVAALAGFQGWDAPMIYGYSQDPFPAAGEERRAWPFSTYNDPAQMALMPVAALLYRRGDIAPARKTYRVALTPAQLFGEEISPETAAALRTIPEQSRLVIGLPNTNELSWDRATTPVPGAVVVADPRRSYLPAGATSVASDTGQISRDWKAGTLKINTPRTQAVAGWLGGHPVATADVSVTLDTPKGVVAVASLDGRPIATSRKLLLTAIGRALPAAEDREPFSSEPIKGVVTIRSDAESLRLIPVNGAGEALEPLPVAKGGGGKGYEISLPAASGSHWFLLQP